MPKYLVEVSRISYAEIELDAASKDEARQLVVWDFESSDHYTDWEIEVHEL